MKKGNVIIGQSGGPTAVINGSLAGVMSEASTWKHIAHIYGMRYGIEGFMGENIIDLGKEGKDTIRQLRNAPGSALGSCRYKLQENNLEHIRKILERYNIRHFFLIGGNDSMDTIHRVEQYCRSTGYEIQCIGIPKTVDNDLSGTDHTPGYPSAARYVALSVQQGGILARDMQKVDQFVIYQAVGRNSGWLAASSVLAKKVESDPPHIILLPERPFELETFLRDFEQCYKKYGWVSIVLGEGVSYGDGTPISASHVTDTFSNIEFGAMAGTSAAMNLHRMISDKFRFRGEFQVVESLQMCAADRMAAVDLKEAFQCGVEAVRLMKSGKTGYMVSIERGKSKQYNVHYGAIAIQDIYAQKTKLMPDEYITSEGNFVTKAFVDYIKPLVGDLPEYISLKGKRV